MSFVTVQDKVLGQLRLILNEKLSVNESKPFTLAKTFNTACMDEETLEIQGELSDLCHYIASYSSYLYFRHCTDGRDSRKIRRMASC